MRAPPENCRGVELGVAARNQGAGVATPFDAPEWRAVLARLDEPERRVFELMRAGERRPSGRRRSSAPKDRVLARLKRFARTQPGDESCTNR